MTEEGCATDLTRTYIVTVMARDHLGIMACITRALADLNGTVLELSQTVMRGYFTIILAAAVPAKWSAERLQERIESAGAPFGLAAHVRAFEPDAATSHRPEPDERYILTVQGDDRPGIIAEMTTYLAAQGINIEDFYARVDGGQFTMVLQIQVSGLWTADQIRLDLETIGSEAGLRAHLMHEAIFRATGEIGAVRRLAPDPSRRA